MQQTKVRVSTPVSGRFLAWFAAIAILIVLVIDGGSVAITRLAVPDDALDAGHAAAGAAAGLPNIPQVAVVAYEAAARNAATAGMVVDRHGFTVFPDGRVTLTVTRTAPTLIFEHLPVLRDLTVVRATRTVSALPYT